jgi:hyaluronan synthase
VLTSSRPTGPAREAAAEGAEQDTPALGPSRARRFRARSSQIGAGLFCVAACAAVAWHVATKVTSGTVATVTLAYTLCVSSYVLSRFVLSALYRPPADAGITPTVAVIVPAYNEGAAVARTVHAIMALDYPADLLEVVCVNDGSSDDTWQHMTEAAGVYEQGSVQCIDLGSNQGKRAAMAAGTRATTAEVLVFVDSDSMPAPGAVRHLVQGFADPEVGAVSGLTYARNADTNALTRMQAARYYVSFQLLKSAESVVNAVACCSGCFAAYRRSAVAPLLAGWERQRFLGVECTYGDDRSLTNMIIRSGWKTVYDSTAEAWTDVPDEYRKFFRQQLRWKKSWAREGPLLLTHVWRTRPLAFPSVVAATATGILSPIVVAANLVWSPAARGVWPLVYLLGLYLIAAAYAAFYRMHRSDGLWAWAMVGTFFYVSFSAQIVWAVIRIRDGAWGTRGV